MKSFKLIAMAALLFLVLMVSDYIFVIGKNEAQVEHIDPNMQWEFFENQILSPQEAKLKRTPLSLLLIDLDYFKLYNDYYGHVKGDMLLQSIVTTINEVLPEEALFSRYGGEEFAIIFPNASKAQMDALGETLVQVVAAKHYEHSQHPLGIATISIGGYTMMPDDDFTSEKQLIKLSDDHLYEAKHNGKNRFIS